MKPFLNQGQYLKLTKALLKTFKNVQIIENRIDYDENSSNENYKLLNLFLSAKQIEGCSPKTIVYYQTTIEKMLMKLEKRIDNISTDDLRKYNFYLYLKFNNSCCVRGMS